jgi:hypothetical protein
LISPSASASVFPFSLHKIIATAVISNVTHSFPIVTYDPDSYPSPA